MDFNSLRQIFKQYFSFSRTERNGLIVLCIILFFVIVGNSIIGFFDQPAKNDFSEVKQTLEQWRNEIDNNNEFENKVLFPFNPNYISESKLDCLAIPGFIKQNIIKYRQSGGKFYNQNSVKRIYGMNDSIFHIISEYLIFDNASEKEVSEEAEMSTLSEPEYFYFDPNNVSEKEMEKLGFSRFQSSNLRKYLESGGYFLKPDDLSKIYGIDSMFYKKLEPWIKIHNDELFERKETLIVSEYKIELNTADSLSLIKLNGIGEVFASRIVRYRELLGGFVNKEQLLEVYNFKTETFQQIQNKIIVDSVNIKRLSLNFSEFSELVRHPYLSAEDVNKILEYRNNYGAFETCDDLLSKNILKGGTYNKIRPYLKLN